MSWLAMQVFFNDEGAPRFSPRAVCVLISIVFAGLSLKVFLGDATYIVSLVSFFIFFLSVFHATLAYRIKITKKMVKSTDYIYFSLAFIGLTIASTAQEN